MAADRSPLTAASQSLRAGAFFMQMVVDDDDGEVSAALFKT